METYVMKKKEALKRNRSKLTLHRETLRRLEEPTLRSVVGGTGSMDYDCSNGPCESLPMCETHTVE